MNFHDYQSAALRTAPALTPASLLVSSAIEAQKYGDLLHGAMGACTEAGELMDICKRHQQYGKPIDWVHAIEEAGDLLWYIALVSRASGVSLEEIAKRNIAKLAKRYPEKFTAELALNRDLTAERQVLEAPAAN
jgi:NTP pyrophosphatase (non-canonical NTP hydrolase)